MKHSLFPALLIGLFASATWAQPSPSFAPMPMMSKSTATWCGPCGQWGWTQMKDHLAKWEGKALMLSVYENSSTTIMKSSNNESQWYYDMLTASGNGIGGFPTFNTNLKILAGPTERDAAMTSFLASGNKQIGMSFHAWKEGLNVKVARFIKTNGVVTGTYTLQSWLVENGVLSTQANQTGTVAHPWVMRRMAQTGLGKTLPAAALGGNLWSDTITFTGDSKFNMNNLQVQMAIFSGKTYYNGYTRPIAQTFQTFSTSSSSVVSSSAQSSSSIAISSSAKSSSSLAISSSVQSSSSLAISSSVLSSSSIAISSSAKSSSSVAISSSNTSSSGALSSSTITPTLKSLGFRHQAKQISSLQSDTRFTLLDAKGRQWGAAQGSMDLNLLPSGTWTLRVQQGEQVLNYTFVQE
jgi:hypothetical protein